MREGFLWSASTSAFQIEGAYKKGNKGLSTVDTRHVKKGTADTKFACDHYHKYKEDIALMAELGLKAYRFSISWPRILPDLSGKVNKEGIDFYNDLINELLKNNIEPLVTIYHFDLPQILVDKFGGWASRETINFYEKYAITLFENFGDRVKKWFTINEQFVVMFNSEFNGMREFENQIGYEKLVYQMGYHMTLAEKKAMKKCKEIIPDAMIGPVAAYQLFYPATAKSEDIMAAFDAEEILSYYLLDFCVKGECNEYTRKYLKEKGVYPEMKMGDEEILKSSSPDFIGINYYFPLTAEFPNEREKNPNFPLFWNSDRYSVTKNSILKPTEWMPFGFDSRGLRSALKKAYIRYSIPLMVTENGVAYSEVIESGNIINDDYRIEYIEGHLKECKKAIEEGIDLIGYSPWSFTDVLSASQGFSKRYGLVYIDRTEDDLKEMRRIPKKSFYWYKNVIKNNGNNL